MKFIHISDVHLGARPDREKKWCDDRAAEIEETFCDVVKLCERDNIDLLLIAGNLFDAPPTVEQLKKLELQLRRLENTKTVILAGSSDYIGDENPWDSFEFESDTVVFPRDRATNAYLQDLNVCITGYSYGKPQYTERILERLRPGKEGAYNILLGHGGDREHMPFSKERLARSGFDYVALGYITKPRHILKNRMAFSGSLEPLDASDIGRRGYILGEVDEDGNTNIKWIPLNKRSYVNMAIDVKPGNTNAELLTLVENNIKSLGEENIYRILLRGVLDKNVALNLSSLVRHYNIGELIDETKQGMDYDDLYIDNRSNIVGQFVRDLYDSDFNDIVDEKEHEARKNAFKLGLDALLGTGDR